jgi:NAD(P) transhydrogenase subunit alpha
MQLAVLKELAPGERRVSLIPESVKKLIQAGFRVAVEAGAGDAAYFADRQYLDAGATIERNLQELFAKADCILKVGIPLTGDGAARDEVALMRSGQMLLTSLMPTRNPAVVDGPQRARRHRLLDRHHPAHHSCSGDGHPCPRWPTSPATRAP